MIRCMDEPFGVFRLQMPIIVRAREYHLYDRKGKRYLDLFQNGGRAILGHRMPGMIRTMKSTASRGLVAEYPSVYERRLERLIRRLLGADCDVRLYPSRLHTREALGKNVIISDPAIDEPNDLGTVMLWRPFLGEDKRTSHILIPVLPFPAGFACDVVCIRNPSIAQSLPPSALVSPMILDALIQAIGALLTFRVPIWDNPLKDFGLCTRGPYCASGLEEDAYEAFFGEALDAGVLIPPDPSFPIIIPPVYTKTEMQIFLAVAQTYLQRK